MPGRVVRATPEQWEAVAQAVEHRRDIELRITQQEAANRSRGLISLPSWSILENAKQKNGTMTSRSLEGVALALGWPGDWFDQVLDGKTPEPTAQPSSNGHSDVADLAPLSEEDKAAVWAIIESLKAKNRP